MFSAHSDDSARIFTAAELLPPQWSNPSRSGEPRFFNPAIAACAAGYIMAYRVVLSDGLRRLAICRLDPNLAVEPGSQLPLSDLLSPPPERQYPGQAHRWFADPRLIVHENRLLLHWNSGSHQPSNHQFLQELDGQSLTPAGRSRELVLPGNQARLEKNWGLFSAEGNLFSVYSLAPLRILRLAGIREGRMEFADASSAQWNHYPWSRRFGTLRGGAPPVLRQGRYVAVYHSCYQTRTGSRYVAGCLTYSGEPPFAPFACAEHPLALPNPFGNRFGQERLNSTVAEVVYPCGALYDGGRWLISYGINDEHAAIAVLDDAAVTGALRPVGRSPRMWTRDWLARVIGR